MLIPIFNLIYRFISYLIKNAQLTTSQHERIIVAMQSSAGQKTNSPDPTLGIRANLSQFILLIVVNAFVGAMVGMERSILPAIAEEEFLLAARTAVLSFIVVFGITKAITNYFAGRFSDAWGRKGVLVAGWLVATPVPFLLMWAPDWSWVLFANFLLGVSQGLTWSTTVIMKIDLAGPKNRGLAMGINEFAGYFALAGAALASGYVASIWGLRPEPFYLGVVFIFFGLILSVFFVRETHHHAYLEAKSHSGPAEQHLSQGEIFRRTSFTDSSLSSVSQAGMVNNLNDGMAWGLFPLFFAMAGLNLKQIGWLAAIYPAVWGIGQLYTGALSDRIGRKGLIVWGMWMQAAGIVGITMSTGFPGFAGGAALLGAGTAMVYPTLLAVIGDVTHPSWRASSVGVYRLWRDLGYAVGALIAGVVADLLGIRAAMWSIAALTFASGLLVLLRMEETHYPEAGT
jgi:MFS family permease